MLEVSDEFVDMVVFYVEMFVVLVCCNVVDEDVKVGVCLFDDLNCIGCYMFCFVIVNGVVLLLGGVVVFVVVKG